VEPAAALVFFTDVFSVSSVLLWRSECVDFSTGFLQAVIRQLPSVVADGALSICCLVSPFNTGAAMTDLPSKLLLLELARFPVPLERPLALEIVILRV
jgi:hypothetical protein